MRSSKLLPQADVLVDVLRVVEAVSRGLTSFQDMAAYMGGKVDRQGRYYRAAAEVINLIRNDPGHNTSYLLPLGMKYIAASPTARPEIIKQALLTNPIICDVLAFIHQCGPNGTSETDLARYLATIADVNLTTARRRTSTLRAWLQDAGLVVILSDQLVATSTPEQTLASDADNVGAVKPTPLLRPASLTIPPAQNTPLPATHLSYVVDVASKERALRQHQQLVLTMAAKLVSLGANPEYNRYVDLAAELNSVQYLFEMKSTTPTSLHSQVRLGISQLYEYRYIQRMPNSHLCLVLDREPKGADAWLVKYLEEDRQITLCWLENGGKFACLPRSFQQIGSLMH